MSARRDATSGAAWMRWPPETGGLLLPIDAPRTAAMAVALEAACSRRALVARRLASVAIARAGAGVLPGTRVRWTPPIEPEAWAALLREIRRAVGGGEAVAIWERRQPGRRGVALLLGGAQGATAFVKVRDARDASPESLETERRALENAARSPRSSFQTPSVLAHGLTSGCVWLALGVVPAFHRPPSEPSLGQVASDVRHCLRDLPHPETAPPHWLPMHGDLTPWNLREDGRGRLWLYDWERAQWAPPAADVVLYRVSAAALRRGSRSAARDACGRWPEAAAFWYERVFARSGAGRGEQRLRSAMLALLGVPARDAEQVIPVSPDPQPAEVM